MNLAAGNGSIF